jgi:hypothetical protein
MAHRLLLARVEEASMERRLFLVRAGQAFPVVAGALYLVACGDDDNPNGVNIRTMVATSTVVDGHAHEATVPEDDIRNPRSVSYDTTVVANHQHRVILSSGDLANLSLGGAVSVSSTTSANHHHDFTFLLS